MTLANQNLKDLMHRAVDSPLVVMGVVNAYCALMAQKAGCKALYLSGAGVANACFGWPDLGFTNVNDVCTEVRRITQCTSIPLLVDADTGWGGPLQIKNNIKLLEQAGASGVHIEDQLSHKRCGHREGKKLVSMMEMSARIRAACHGRQSANFLIMARTDALAIEGAEATLKRAKAYVAAGAEALFLEAVTDTSQIKLFKSQLDIPILVNLTEFGKTPNWSQQDLAQHHVNAVLYPLSAFRAMNKAAENVYQTIMSQGTQQSLLKDMQTRVELYEYLDYENYEKQIDQYIQDQGE